MTPRDACVDCRGDGKCSECNGTGINVHLNHDEAKCRHCSGTGICPKCGGSGRGVVLPLEILDLGLNKL